MPPTKPTRDLAEVQEAVRKYEEFIDGKLKVDLEAILKIRDRLYDEMSEYHKLRTAIVSIQDTVADTDDHSLRTMVDLGCNVYSQAKVEDTRRICVNIGFGFHLEMTHEEALNFIKVKLDHMKVQGEKLTDQSNEVKAHIKMVLSALQELQFEYQYSA